MVAFTDDEGILPVHTWAGFIKVVLKVGVFLGVREAPGKPMRFGVMENTAPSPSGSIVLNVQGDLGVYHPDDVFEAWTVDGAQRRELVRSTKTGCYCKEASPGVFCTTIDGHANHCKKLVQN